MLKLLDISKICYTTQMLNSYNLLTDKKWLKKWLEKKQTRRKKLKKYWKVGIELSINDIPKSRQNKPSLTCWKCQKKIVEYTDLTPIIYWSAKIA